MGPIYQSLGLSPLSRGLGQLHFSLSFAGTLFSLIHGPSWRPEEERQRAFDAKPSGENFTQNGNALPNFHVHVHMVYNVIKTE